MTPSLSLIYLCLNEERSLPATLAEAVAYCTSALPDWEILVVDDGSTDGSAELVLEAAAAEPRIRLLQHDRNRGMGAGLRTGIAASTKEYFCMLAADGQIPAAELAKMLPALELAPIVLSTYGNRPNNWLRTFISRGFRVYMRALIGVDFALEGTYLFPVALARDEIGLPRIGADTFFFSFELIAQALRRGYRVADTTIAGRPRTDGTPSRIANLKQIKRVAGEVLAFRQRDRKGKV
ncbi:MAG: glycosyltransferase family 2 protein [Deltaproteobacteria bacterium]|nr:glycosyltransferase family 2 protein [Deltaproteobacteria bacterium]